MPALVPEPIEERHGATQEGGEVLGTAAVSGSFGQEDL